MATGGALSRALRKLISDRVDARVIGPVRIVIGLAAIARAYEAWRLFTKLYAPTTIQLPYVSWIPDLPASGVTPLLAVWVASAVLFAIGWRTRVAGAVLAGVLLYVLLLDEQTYSNHLYLMAIVVALLVLANAGAAYSVDEWSSAGARWPHGESATIPAWPVWLLKLQVSVVYGFAALAKVHLEYLAGATLLAFWPPSVRAALPEPLLQPVLIAASWASIVLEVFVALALWFPRWRNWAVVVGMALHVGMVLILPAPFRLQLVIFAVEMLALYTLFFPLRVGTAAEARDDAPERRALPADPSAASPVGPARAIRLAP